VKSLQRNYFRTKAALLHLTGFVFVKSFHYVWLVEKRKLKGLAKLFEAHFKLSCYRYTGTLTWIVATGKYLVLSPSPSKSCKSECFSRQRKIRALTTLLKLNGLLGSGVWWRDWQGGARVAQLDWTWAGNLVLYSFLTVEDDDDRWFICICCLFLRFLFFD